jgi:hypothetical protein
LASSYPLQLARYGMMQLDNIMRGEIRKPRVLQPTPERLDGIPHRGIGRQGLNDQASFVPGEQFPNGISLMHSATVPKHDPPSPVLSEKIIDEDGDLDIGEVSIDQSLIA